MKKIFVIIIVLFAVNLSGQDLSKDVNKEFKYAETLKSKKKYNEAIVAYKEVLRSVAHIESMEAIGDINLKLKARPNNREACEYYQMALDEIAKQLSEADKKSDKARLGKAYERIEPKKNKSCSYIKDFDDAKEKKKEGSRLLEEEGLD